MFKNLFLPISNHNYIIKRLAGHSKWANIKHTKGLKDAQRGRAFTKIGQQIKVAIQEGGSPNPAMNTKLQQIVDQAKRMSMPVASIESIIKSTQKDPAQCKSHLFEIKGPGGCIVLCEVFSPNLVKTKYDITTIIKKHASKFSDGGGQHLFEQKGLIETKIPANIKEGTSDEEILELATNHAIECDAEDVELLEENLLQFICNPHNFPKVQKQLETLNYDILNASLQYVPNMRISLSDSDLELCSSMFDKLETLSEVVQLHDNIG